VHRVPADGLVSSRRRSLVGPTLVSLGFALFVGPGPLGVLVPWLITRWRIEDPLLGVTALRGVGVVLITLGLPCLVESIVRFVRIGRGTLAPVMPTERLVVTGLYRYVRNPMYVGVVSLIVGQALLFGSGATLLYAVAVATGFHLFVVLYEEPTMRRTYGEEYKTYCLQVRRWLPRIRSTPTRGGR
jgi:protein-S-isoprenylcysteine O-methyltransferase Ste14